MKFRNLNPNEIEKIEDEMDDIKDELREEIMDRLSKILEQCQYDGKYCFISNLDEAVEYAMEYILPRIQ